MSADKPFMISWRKTSMKTIKMAFLSLAALALVAVAMSAPPTLVHAQKNGDGGGGSAPIKYPETKKVEVVEDYFGTKVADPYRWLENNDSPEVAEWVAAENKVTYSYLDQIPYRKAVFNRLSELYNYPKFSAPTRRGEWFVFSKNDGLQNQSVY